MVLDAVCRHGLETQPLPRWHKILTLSLERLDSAIATPLDTGFRSERRIKKLLLTQGIQGKAVGACRSASSSLLRGALSPDSALDLAGRLVRRNKHLILIIQTERREVDQQIVLIGAGHTDVSYLGHRLQGGGTHTE
jgi:hypothetical protein